MRPWTDSRFDAPDGFRRIPAKAVHERLAVACQSRVQPEQPRKSPGGHDATAPIVDLHDAVAGQAIYIDFDRVETLTGH